MLTKVLGNWTFLLHILLCLENYLVYRKYTVQAYQQKGSAYHRPYMQGISLWVMFTVTWNPFVQQNWLACFMCILPEYMCPHRFGHVDECPHLFGLAEVYLYQIEPVDVYPHPFGPLNLCGHISLGLRMYVLISLRPVEVWSPSVWGLWKCGPISFACGNVSPIRLGLRMCVSIILGLWKSDPISFSLCKYVPISLWKSFVPPSAMPCFTDWCIALGCFSSWLRGRYMSAYHFSSVSLTGSFSV